jgi:hypothetical protein
MAKQLQGRDASDRVSQLRASRSCGLEHDLGDGLRSVARGNDLHVPLVEGGTSRHYSSGIVIWLEQVRVDGVFVM